jgi:hypothetical protein
MLIASLGGLGSFFPLSAAIKVIFQTSWVCHDDYGGHLRVISHDIDSMPIQRNVCQRHRFIKCWHITGPSTGGLPHLSVPTDPLRIIPHLASRIPPPALYGLTTTPSPLFVPVKTFTTTHERIGPTQAHWRRSSCTARMGFLSR